MPTPEQQKEYWRLSDQLLAIVKRHSNELPKGSISLSLSVANGKAVVDIYDGLGKKIGAVPNQTTSKAFSSDLENTFARATFPDNEPVIVMVSNTINLKGNL